MKPFHLLKVDCIIQDVFDHDIDHPQLKTETLYIYLNVT